MRPSLRRLLARFCLFAMGLLALPPSVTLAQTPSPATAAPVVTELRGDFGVGYVVHLHVNGLGAWVAAGHDPNKLVPYLNGRGLHGLYPVEVHSSANDVFFELDVTPASRDPWSDILGPITLGHKPVEVSVGLDNDTPFASNLTGKNSPEFIVVQQPYGWVSFGVIVATLVALIVLARRTDILRDTGAPPPSGQRRPYNLGRVQMAFWFFLTVASYIVIWLLTDAIDTITPALLGLMGISAGTALGEALIDVSKDANAVTTYNASVAEKAALEQTIADLQAQLAVLTAKVAPTADDAAVRDALNRQLLEQRTRLNQLSINLKTLAPTVGADASQGFFADILSDGSGYSFHRFQIFIWTLVLGGVFISRVYNNLVMPEFSTTMLGLMGLSSGTYIGFKFPEQR